MKKVSILEGQGIEPRALHMLGNYNIYQNPL
jgi:hypothetical protein